MTAFARMIAYLNMLDDKGVSYTLEHDRPDAITATVSIVGARIEIDFLDGRIEYTVFSSDEQVSDDMQTLQRMIDRFVG
jgi:hypothetical protein